MPKQHKDWDKIGITWSGGLDHPDAGNQNQSIPGSIEDTPLISLGKSFVYHVRFFNF